jgi:hypothetical protein
MKKITLLAVILASTLGAFSQGFYGGIQTGFARGQATANEEENNDDLTYAAVRFGSGLNVGGILGYNFNENLGFELGFNYLLGTKSTLTDESSESFIDGQGYFDEYSSTSTSTFKSRMFRICPTLVMKSSRQGIAPYVKFGAVIGMASKITTEQESSSNSINGYDYYGLEWWDVTYREDVSSSEFKKAENYAGGISLGVVSSLGINIPMSEKLSFFSELSFIGLNWAPEQRETTAYEYDSESQTTDYTNGLTYPTSSISTDLSDLDDYQVYTNYVESIDTSDEFDENDPSEEIKEFKLFNSIGINVGLNFGF